MNLTEFLLARIAEDEDRLPRHGGLDSLTQRRWRAECEAKRRVVDVHYHLPDDPEPFCWNCDEETWPCKTMAALGTIYADHHDYDESWRP